MSIPRDLWLDALAEAIPATNQDALTTSEFATKYGFKRSTAKARLQVLEKAGTVRRDKKTLVDAVGRTQIVPAWSLVPVKTTTKKKPR